jgi:hypothetical protein
MFIWGYDCCTKFLLYFHFEKKNRLFKLSKMSYEKKTECRLWISCYDWVFFLDCAY